MVLELHIWGPAFSLPSIDPECLAAVAYCTHAVPRGEWVLVASGAPSLSPTKELPALRDETRWIGGFRNIVDYLREHSEAQWDLDSGLSPPQIADCTAFSTFLHTHLSLLLSLSLYVSSTNYPLTRTAYSPLLQWPTQYLIPPQRRAAAKARTHYLALSSLDLDTAAAENENEIKKPGEDQIPRSLRKTKKGVSEALKRGECAARFRLDALMENAFGPLQELLGDKMFFLSDKRPSSLDCLALGYLSLALIPALPQPWLADTLEAKYAPLCRYVRESLLRMGGMDVSLEDALLAPLGLESERGPMSTEDSTEDTESAREGLPWRRPGDRGFISVVGVFLDRTLDSLPLRSAPLVLQPASSFENDNASDPQHRSQSAPPSQRHPPSLPTHLVSLGAAALAIAGYLVFNTGLLLGPPHTADEKRKLADMGEAGAMLALASFGEDVREARLGKALIREGEASVVEVDVAVEDRRGMDGI